MQGSTRMLSWVDMVESEDEGRSKLQILYSRLISWSKVVGKNSEIEGFKLSPQVQDKENVKLIVEDIKD